MKQHIPKLVVLAAVVLLAYAFFAFDLQHYLTLDYIKGQQRAFAEFYADNALLAVFEVLNLLWQSGEPLSRLIAPLRRYAKSEETNFEVEDKQGMIAALAERYAGAEIDYLDGITVQYPDWWFNVRPSNTEPYLRLVAEAATPEQLAEKMAELVGILGRPV